MIEENQLQAAYEVFGRMPDIRRHIIYSILGLIQAAKQPGCGMGDFRSLTKMKDADKSIDDFTATGRYIDTEIVRLSSVASKLRGETGSPISVYDLYRLPVLEDSPKNRINKVIDEYGMADGLKATPIWPLPDRVWVDLKCTPSLGWKLVLPLMIASIVYENLFDVGQKPGNVTAQQHHAADPGPRPG